MNTLEVSRIMKNNRWTKPYYLGTFPCDFLPSTTKRPLCFIANTDKSTECGSHWVGIYINGKNRANFFDSYGRAPYGIFKQYLETHAAAYTYNRKQVQSFGSSVCGQHCILFLYFRCQGQKMASILAHYKPDTVLNDTVACISVNEAFDVTFPLVHESLNQTATPFT